MPAPAVEKFVLSELRKLSIDPKAVKAAVCHANEGRDVELVRVEAEPKEKRFAEQEQGRALQRRCTTFEASDGDDPFTIKKRMRERETVQQKLREEIADLEAKRLDLKSKMLDAEVVAEGFSKLPTLIKLADESGDRENLRTLLRNVVDVIEWRQDADDPKKGAARVRLYELPKGFWGTRAQKKTSPANR